MTVGLIVPNEGEIYIGNTNITKFPSTNVHAMALVISPRGIHFQKNDSGRQYPFCIGVTDKTPKEQKQKLEV